MEKFPEILKRRREIASQYLRELNGCPGISLPADNPEHTWQTFMIVLDKQKDRSFIINNLMESGLDTGAGSVAGHCKYIYRKTFGYKAEDLPVSAKLNFQGLALPLYPQMQSKDVLYCVQEVRNLSSGTLL